MGETATNQTTALMREEAVVALRRLHADLAEATSELSEDEYEALVARIAEELNEALRFAGAHEPNARKSTTARQPY